MPVMAEINGFFWLLRLIGRGLLPVALLLAFTLNAFAMSKEMPITAPAQTQMMVSMMPQHAPHTVADANYCQQMILCTAAFSTPPLGEIPGSLLRLPRSFMSEYGYGRAIWPPIQPPIV